MSRHIILGVLMLSTLFHYRASSQTEIEWTGFTNNWNPSSNWTPNSNVFGKRLEFKGNGTPVSNNNYDIGNSVIKRITFSGNTPYTITSTHPIQFRDGDVGQQGMIIQSSDFAQTFGNGPLTFNDVDKFGFIGTKSTGALNFNGTGTITLGPQLNSLRLSSDVTTGIVTISKPISGTAPISIGLDETNVFRTSTRVIFSENNAGFNGNVLILSGSLSARHANALGMAGLGYVEVLSGAALEVQGGVSLAEKEIQIQGNGISNGGALRNVSGNNTVQGDIILTSGSRIVNVSGSLVLNDIGRLGNTPWNLYFEGSGNVSVNGTIGQLNDNLSLGDLTKGGTGTLTLLGAANYTGVTRVTSGGRLQLGAPNLLPDTTHLELNTGRFRTGAGVGYSQQLGKLSLQASGSGNINSYIELGTGSHELRFANSNDMAWPTNLAHRLIINGWVGTVNNSGTAGRIFFAPQDASTPGLTESQLNQITFAGFCDGAILRADGELVPANLPLLRTVGGNPPGGSLSSFQGYVGADITLKGCQFSLVTSINIGDTTGIPFTLDNDGQITFKLGDNVSGFITLVAASGTRTTNTPLINLDYITTVNTGTVAFWPWTEPNRWLGNTIPPANRAITLRSPVRISSLINDPNPIAPYTKPILINSSGAIMLANSNVIPNNTPIHLNGGTLRVYDGASNQTPLAGQNETMGTLTLLDNSGIALGTGVHTLRFSNSSAIDWTSNKVLTIYNWEGPVMGPGTAGQIFIGNNAAALTDEQLKQINFNGYCFGAKLLASGELVPSDNPFIAAVNGDPGIADGGYIGGKVRINGCQLEDVDIIKIGPVYQVPAFARITIDPDGTPGNGDEYLVIEFELAEDAPDGTIFLYTDILGVEGEMDGMLRNLGYITKADGVWNTNTTWLGPGVPQANRNITINNNVQLDIDIEGGNIPNTLTVNGGVQFDLSANRILNIGNELVTQPNAMIVPGAGSLLNIKPGGIIANNGIFDSNNQGEVNFEGSGTVQGTEPIRFNNLTINAGEFSLPLRNSGAVPFITGNFRINGGGFNPANPATNTGPIYTQGSNLIYASGSSYSRSLEWNSSGSAASSLNYAGYPFNVIIENGTHLWMENGIPDPQPTIATNNTILLAGSLRITHGGISFTRAGWHLEVRGNVELGNDPILSSDTARLNIQSVGGLRIHGSLIKWVNATFNQTAGTVEFTGNQNAIISSPGQTIISDNPNIIFRSLSVNKTEGAELILACPIEIITSITTGALPSLVLTSGVITTTSTNFLRVSPRASIIGGSNVSFVNGPLQKVTSNAHVNASSNFEFKIGKKSGVEYAYRPLWVANLQHTGSTTYTVEFNDSRTINNTPFNLNFLIQPTGILEYEWWKVDKSGNGSARVGVPYNPPEAPWFITGPQEGDNIAVVKYHGVSGEEDWRFTKDFGNFSNNTFPYPEIRGVNEQGIVYSDILNTFSPFTLGFNYNNILPIQLLSFTAVLRGTDALLQWKIADAKDLSHFEVEHGTDGVNFRKIATVTSQELKEYQYVHAGLSKGIHYYRLNMVEKDGTKSYSKIEFVQVATSKTIIIGLQQNPIQAGTAMVRVYSAEAQKAEAMVVDVSGRMMLRQTVTLHPGNNLTNITVFPLVSGQYFLKLTTRDGVEKVLPFIK